MSGPDTASTLSARRRVGRAVRGHWRRVTGAVLIGIGAAVGIIAEGSANGAGWRWWLAAAGCATLGTLLGFYPGSRAPDSAQTITASEPVPGRAAQTGRVWNIPAPVRSFTGRDAQLAALRNHLNHQRRAALIPAAALYGMGGIGKTQLARAYAHRYRDHYRLGWWIPAETPLTTTTALAWPMRLPR